MLPSALAHSVRSSPRSIQRPRLWLIPRLCLHLGWEPLAARSNSAARPATAIDEEIRSNGNWYFCMLLFLLLSRGPLPLWTLKKISNLLSLHLFFNRLQEKYNLYYFLSMKKQDLGFTLGKWLFSSLSSSWSAFEFATQQPTICGSIRESLELKE